MATHLPDADALVVPAFSMNMIGETSDPSIATFKNGNLTGENVGTCTLTLYADKDGEKGNILKVIQIEVVPTLSLTLKSGQAVNIIDELAKVIGEDNAKKFAYYDFKPSDENIAHINPGAESHTTALLALQPGTVTVKTQSRYNNNYTISVIVEPAFTEPYWPEILTKYQATDTEVRNFMQGKAGEPEWKKVTTGGFTYSALIYKNAGKAKATIQYLFKEIQEYDWSIREYITTYKLDQIQIQTPSASDNYAWLCQTYEYWDSNHFRIQTGSYPYKYITKTSDSWADITIE